MNVVLFGASGMVGQGVLRECVLDPDVARLVVVGRAPLPEKNPKVEEIVHADLADVAGYEDRLDGFDACFFCLGVSSAGMSEADYTRVTYDLTIAIARVLAAKNPKMTFVYVSGASTDATEKGSSMWARVKGRTENALFAMPFASAVMFRPGIIQPLHGIRSKTKLYNAAYVVLAPLFPVFNALFPRAVTTTEKVGRAMLAVAKRGSSKKLLENADINDIATS